MARRKAAASLTHVDPEGRVRMVDVSAKAETRREAVAEGEIRMSAAARRAIRERTVAKGDPLQTARIAGIMAAKRTWELIPLCHPIALTHLELELEPLPDRSAVRCRATAETVERTGVEMEALTAVQVALLTVYDMCKAIDKGMRITDVTLLRKSGGRSGDWNRPG